MKKLLLLLVLLLNSTVFILHSFAQWSSSSTVNNVICTATGNQLSPKLISDGAGGAIITWMDGRSGTADIYIQRINASGVVQWTANGVAVCTAGGDQFYPELISDGAGGAIITWYDWRGATTDVYAQRINASGVVQWTANGVVVCSVAGNEEYPQLVSDGAAGAIITWRDWRAGSNSNIYAQRINASGVVQWTANGVAVCTATGNQLSPKLISDGAGGAIITWEDGRGSNYDIYYQRINASGVVQWSSNGEITCNATGDQYVPEVISDGSGGAIFTWQDRRNATPDVFTQRINSSGAVQWTANGVGVCTATGDQYSSQLVSDGAGGAIITWQDNRIVNYDTYAQNVCSTGAIGPCSITWTGSTSTAWATDGNWSSGSAPISTDNVIIPNVTNDPLISGTVTINNITLQSGAILTVANGGSLTLNGTLANAGAVTIQSGGSFLQGGSSSITGAGTFTVQRQGHSSSTKYNFWSSPITSGTLPGTNGYYYNSALGTHSNSDDNPGPDPGWVSTSGTMTVGKGYASVGGGLASFTGTVNNGTITTAVTTSAQISTSLTAPSYFNLVGNPYPSSISTTTFLSANALIDGTVWLWDDDNSGGTGYTYGDYATRTSLGGTAGGGGNTPNGNIGSGQAFFVKANSNGNVTFANDQRGTSNTQFLKTEEEASRLWLSFKNDNHYNEILVGFMAGATDGYDNNYDGYKFRGNPYIAFAAMQEGEEFAIAAFPPVSVERIIPLTTYVSDEGLYTISNKEEEYMDGMSVYLEDRLLGIFTDISGNGSYSALINEANSANRFYLHFAPLSVTGVQENNPTLVSAYTSAGELTVLFANLEESNATFSIMDMMGKTVYSQPNINLSGNVFRTPVSSLASGVYVIRFNTDNAVYTRKIFIN